MQTLGSTQLLIIDPQNDFCDIDGASLPVQGASGDLDRLSGLLDRLGGQLDDIHVTLDSHHPLHIAHPAWWRDANGTSPTPFTLISLADVQSGKWQARDPARQRHSQAYVEALAARGRYQLVIWPEHCLIGSWGHAVQPRLFDTLAQWGRRELRTVNYVTKGSNPGTEHYSAIQAEVPDPADAGTLPNQALLARLAKADTVLIAGQALSHCVASTVRDLAEHWGSANKLVLIDDCSSPVPGFEAQGQAFVQELTARGMRLASSRALAKLA
ncbi:cysteine hydrolase family protein [Chitinimonas naiadis]